MGSALNRYTGRLMKYARMGDSGLIVSRLSLGAMTFTLGNKSMEAIYKVGPELANEMVAKAIDKGVNFFDTADGYAGGESETILGRALEGRRDDVVIATKYGFRAGETLTHAGLSRQHTIRAAERSLKRLDTDWIDLLICHKHDETTPLEETLVALDRLVRDGKVRYIGFSNWPAWRVAAALEFQKANGLARFVSGQIYYSLVGRDAEIELVPMMEQFGIGMMVWSPLAQGFLTGRITPDNLKDGDHRLASFDFIPKDLDRGFTAVDRLKEIAAEKGCSIPQAALAWLLSKPAATNLILGASKMAHLEDNLGAADVELTPEEVATLDAAAPPPAPYPHWFIALTQDQAHRDALS